MTHPVLASFALAPNLYAHGAVPRHVQQRHPWYDPKATLGDNLAACQAWRRRLVRDGEAFYGKDGVFTFGRKP